MSYLWYLIFGDDDEPEVNEEKDRQKHLKYLCCKIIEKQLPRLKSVNLKGISVE